MVGYMEVMEGCSGQDSGLGSGLEELCQVYRALGYPFQLRSLPPLFLSCLDALVSGIPVLLVGNYILLVIQWCIRKDFNVLIGSFCLLTISIMMEGRGEFFGNNPGQTTLLQGPLCNSLSCLSFSSCMARSASRGIKKGFIQHNI